MIMQSAAGFLRTLDRLYGYLLQGMMAAAGIYIGMMMLVIVYYTSFRSLSLPYNQYSFTFIEYGFIYVLMLGSPWLVRRRGHVYIEMVTAAVSDRVRHVLSRIIATVCFFVCLALGWYTGVLAWQDYSFNQYDDLRAQLDIKRWVVMAAMPVGFGLMAVEFLRFVFGRELMHTGEAGVHE